RHPARCSSPTRRSSDLGEHVEVIMDHIGISVDSPRESPLVDAMTGAIQAEDPGSRVLPYCLSAGTDNKPLSTLGIAGYGFAPLQDRKSTRLNSSHVSIS